MNLNSVTIILAFFKKIVKMFPLDAALHLEDSFEAN